MCYEDSDKILTKYLHDMYYCDIFASMHMCIFMCLFFMFTYFYILFVHFINCGIIQQNLLLLRHVVFIKE